MDGRTGASEQLAAFETLGMPLPRWSRRIETYVKSPNSKQLTMPHARECAQREDRHRRHPCVPVVKTDGRGSRAFRATGNSCAHHSTTLTQLRLSSSHPVCVRTSQCCTQTRSRRPTSCPTALVSLASKSYLCAGRRTKSTSTVYSSSSDGAVFFFFFFFLCAAPPPSRDVPRSHKVAAALILAWSLGPA